MAIVVAARPSSGVVADSITTAMSSARAVATQPDARSVGCDCQCCWTTAVVHLAPCLEPSLGLHLYVHHVRLAGFHTD